MNHKFNIKTVAHVICLGVGGAVLFNASVSAIAQGRPSGPQPGSFGGPGGPAFRRSEKMRLGGFLRGVSELEKAKKTPLNKAQAQKIVATIAPWRKKASMSDADAKKLSAALYNTLTAAQKTSLEKMRPGRPGGPGGFGGNRGPGGRPDGPPRGERPDGPRGGFGGPGNRRGGPPPGGFGRGPDGDHGGRDGDRPAPPTEAQMKKMEAFMKTFNPFYPVTSYKQLKELPRPMQEGMQRRYKETQAILTQLSAKARK